MDSCGTFEAMQRFKAACEQIKGPAREAIELPSCNGAAFATKRQALMMVDPCTERLRGEGLLMSDDEDDDDDSDKNQGYLTRGRVILTGTTSTGCQYWNQHHLQHHHHHQGPSSPEVHPHSYRPSPENYAPPLNYPSLINQNSSESGTNTAENSDIFASLSASSGPSSNRSSGSSSTLASASTKNTNEGNIHIHVQCDDKSPTFASLSARSKASTGSSSVGSAASAGALSSLGDTIDATMENAKAYPVIHRTRSNISATSVPLSTRSNSSSGSSTLSSLGDTIDATMVKAPAVIHRTKSNITASTQQSSVDHHSNSQHQWIRKSLSADEVESTWRKSRQMTEDNGLHQTSTLDREFESLLDSNLPSKSTSKEDDARPTEEKGGKQIEEEDDTMLSLWEPITPPNNHGHYPADENESLLRSQSEMTETYESFLQSKHNGTKDSLLKSSSESSNEFESLLQSNTAGSGSSNSQESSLGQSSSSMDQQFDSVWPSRSHQDDDNDSSQRESSSQHHHHHGKQVKHTPTETTVETLESEETDDPAAEDEEGEPPSLQKSSSSSSYDPNDPYAWAYEVWRRKGLLAVCGGGGGGQVDKQVHAEKPASAKLPSLPSNYRGQQYHSLPNATLSSSSEETSSNFSNVLQKWKKKSRDEPDTSHLLPERAAPVPVRSTCGVRQQIITRTEFFPITRSRSESTEAETLDDMNQCTPPPPPPPPPLFNNSNKRLSEPLTVCTQPSTRSNRMSFDVPQPVHFVYDTTPLHGEEHPPKHPMETIDSSRRQSSESEAHSESSAAQPIASYRSRHRTAPQSKPLPYETSPSMSLNESVEDRTKVHQSLSETSEASSAFQNKAKAWRRESSSRAPMAPSSQSWYQSSSGQSSQRSQSVPRSVGQPSSANNVSTVARTWRQDCSRAQSPAPSQSVQSIGSLPSDCYEPVKEPVSQAARLKTIPLQQRRRSREGPFADKNRSKSNPRDYRQRPRTLPRSNGDYKSAINTVLQHVENDEIEKVFSRDSADSNDSKPKEVQKKEEVAPPPTSTQPVASSRDSEMNGNRASTSRYNTPRGLPVDPPAWHNRPSPRPDHSPFPDRVEATTPPNPYDIQAMMSRKNPIGYTIEIEKSRPSLERARKMDTNETSSIMSGSRRTTPMASTIHSLNTSADSPWMHLLEDDGMDSEYDEDDERKMQETSQREAFAARPWRKDSLIRKVDSFGEQQSAAVATEYYDGPCLCSNSMFSGNDDLIEFYLPLMGMACTCGARPKSLPNEDEPASLENILRPWQVEFLAAFGIYRGDQLVKAHHRSAAALATAMRKYRKKHSMTPFRSKSCAVALSIWAKTAKAFVRSIRKQLTSGTTSEQLKIPNTLYILSSFLEKIPLEDEGSSHQSTV